MIQDIFLLEFRRYNLQNSKKPKNQKTKTQKTKKLKTKNVKPQKPSSDMP